MIKKITLFIVSVVCFFSCVTTKQINYLQTPKCGIPNYIDTFSFSEYKLLPGDYINIRVNTFSKEDLAFYNGLNTVIANTNADAAFSRLYLYLVDNKGNIDYPTVGEVYVKGKTTREVKFELEDLFKKNIAKYDVSIDVYLANRSFSIIGASGSKRINLPHEKITIFQALAMAGDLNQYADRSLIKLIRQTEQGTVVKEFDLRTVKIIDSEYYYIQPNDVVYVQQTFSKYVGINHVTRAVSTSLSTVAFVAMVYKIGLDLKWWTNEKK